MLKHFEFVLDDYVALAYDNGYSLILHKNVFESIFFWIKRCSYEIIVDYLNDLGVDYLNI